VPDPAPGRLLPGPAGPPAVRWVAYVDLDAYYVSCELRDRPDLNGRPVIVGRAPAPGATRGVVLSASYEARAFGVHSAMPAVVAARRCPEATWIPPDFPKYERIARSVRAVLGRFAPHVVPFSIDEAALELDAGSADEARRTAVAIQAALRAELALPASIGVASSRTVAKIATDRAKPAGILVVRPDEVAAFLGPLPVRVVPGVGPRTEELLRRAGVSTIGELADRNPRELERQIGGFARELVALAKGRPNEGELVASGPRSRSTDRTFERDAAAWEEVAPTLATLAEELAASLAQERLRYGTVGVGFRWTDLARSQRVRGLGAAHEGAGPMVEAALRLGRELWDAERAGAGRAVRTVSVRAEQLAPAHQRQRSLDDRWGEPARPADR